MKKGLTELVVIIDKSGSMSGLESDVVGGFNSLIEEQKKLEGDVTVTTLLFDDCYYIIHDRENINNIKPMEASIYKPSGCTALLDTLGSAVMHIKSIYKSLKEDAIPEHTIFSIMTDGYENASHKFTYDMVKELISGEEKNGWQFIYQAANIDAKKEGSKLGINLDNVDDFECTPDGVCNNFATCSNKIVGMRKKVTTKNKKK